MFIISILSFLFKKRMVFGIHVLIKYEEIDSKPEITTYDPNKLKDPEAKKALRLLKEMGAE